MAGCKLLYSPGRSRCDGSPTLMATVLTMQDQFAMLRMVIDRNDPVHLEAEAAFAAMIAKVTQEADITAPMANRMMRGTAEAYDALAHDAEWRSPMLPRQIAS